jgi:hypothetical protein
MATRLVKVASLLSCSEAGLGVANRLVPDQLMETHAPREKFDLETSFSISLLRPETVMPPAGKASRVAT